MRGKCVWEVCLFRIGVTDVTNVTSEPKYRTFFCFKCVCGGGKNFAARPSLLNEMIGSDVNINFNRIIYSERKVARLSLCSSGNIICSCRVKTRSRFPLRHIIEARQAS